MNFYAGVLIILLLVQTVSALYKLSQDYPTKSSVVVKGVDLCLAVVGVVLSIWSVYVFFTV